MAVWQAEALGIIPDLSSSIPKPFPGATSDDQYQQQQQQYQLVPPAAGSATTTGTSTGAPAFVTLGGLPPANHFDNILSVTRRRGSVGAAGIAASGPGSAAAGLWTTPGAAAGAAGGAGGWAGWLPDTPTVTSGPVTDAVSPLDHLLPLLKKKRRRQVVFPRGGRLSRVLRSTPPPDIPMPFTRSLSLEQLAAMHIQPPLLSHRPPPVCLWDSPDSFCLPPLGFPSVFLSPLRVSVWPPPATLSSPPTYTYPPADAGPPSTSARAALPHAHAPAPATSPVPTSAPAAAAAAVAAPASAAAVPGTSRLMANANAAGIGLKPGPNTSGANADSNATGVGGSRGGVGAGGVQSGLRGVGGVRGGEGGVGVARGGVGAGGVRDGGAGSKAPFPGVPGVASPYMAPKQRSHAQRVDKNV
ncbi:unnamed protein product [Closterium sp. NIES-53]